MTVSSLRSVELSAEGLAAAGPRNECDREPIHLSGAVQPHGFLLVVDPASLVVTAASENVPPALGGFDDPLGMTLEQVLGEEIARVVRDMQPSGNPHDSLSERVQLPTALGSSRTSYDLMAHRRGPALILEFQLSNGSSEAPSARFFRDAMKALLTVDELGPICELTVREMRRLTGYDRVMIYQFEPDGHGHVIAEACREGVDQFIGLHYPAADIPRQARALYLRNWIRVIADVGYVSVPIRALPTGIPVDQIDLSMSVLRSVSPVHLQYLQNMGVAATMTVSLIVDNQLWGMISCHHDTPKYVDHSQRLACETLGQLVSMRLRSAEVSSANDHARSLSRMAAQLATAMAAGENPALGAAAAPEALLGMVEAEGAVVEIDGVRVTVGVVPSPQVLDVLIPHFAALGSTNPGPLVHETLPSELADALSGTLGADAATGTLFLPLPGRADGFVLWMRGERARTVRWAGHHGPEAQPGGEAPSVTLTPRASFEEWRERVSGTSPQWRPAEISTAQELAQAMPEVLLHRAQNRLVRLALHDPLTGLPNRTHLHDRLDEMLNRLPIRTFGQAKFDATSAVMFLDIDGFKTINDTLGHLVGDEVLSLVANRIGALLRPQDIVARMGGDEFVVLAPGIGVNEAAAIGQRIVDDFRQTLVVGDQVIRSLTVSVGVTVVDDGTEPGEALRQADSAMYHAKRSGRNQVAVFDPTSGMAANRQELARDELRAAIDSNQITVHYQPIFDLLDNAEPVLRGFEALARWQHPIRGLVPPDQFIGLAEDTGLIHALGERVMSQALQQLQSWPDRGLTMSVNVSVDQLVRPGFAAKTLAQLLELGVEPQRVCLEITESQMMEQPDLALAALAELSASNVCIAIDDFGTGYSSLAYVRDLPATHLKIDKLFVGGLPHNERDVAVVRATVQLAHSLGMRTVAEGVETAVQLASLCELGSDSAQGYLLGRPSPAESVHLPGGRSQQLDRRHSPTTAHDRRSLDRSRSDSRRIQ